MTTHLVGSQPGEGCLVGAEVHAQVAEQQEVESSSTQHRPDRIDIVRHPDEAGPEVRFEGISDPVVSPLDGWDLCGGL